ncbi:MAG: methylated-DNA--[Victivallales bacterium]|nr:methylated-DNA--[protein]-cysteine S-methyltransferase [Victivallales bacterium]
MTAEFQARYQTPDGLDDLQMCSDGECLTGLHFVHSTEDDGCTIDMAACEPPVFLETRRWLDCYFAGRAPEFLPRYRIVDGLTDFRRAVLGLLLEIPFGQTTTYGALAKEMARRRGMARMSAQAVGGAVGWNPLCIVIPCHRVVGADGSMTGYGGGVPNKLALLAHEMRWKGGGEMRNEECKR